MEKNQLLTLYAKFFIAWRSLWKFLIGEKTIQEYNFAQ